MASRSNGKVLIPVLPVRDQVYFPRLVSTLHVARDGSVRAVRSAWEARTRVLVLTQRDGEVEQPGLSDFPQIGTLSDVLQAMPMPDGGLRVVLRGVCRARVRRLSHAQGQLRGAVEEIVEKETTPSPEVEALVRACIEGFTGVVGLNRSIPPESLASVTPDSSPGVLADTITSHLPLSAEVRQGLLEILDPAKRLEDVLKLIKREESVLSYGASLQARVEKQLGEAHREYYLREQLKVVQEELARGENRQTEGELLESRIAAASPPPEVEARIRDEARRMAQMQPQSAELSVASQYVDTLLQFPWSVSTRDDPDLRHVARVLDERHYGLDEAKERILESLAVRKLKQDARFPIVCLVGAPGVGKTSLAKSVADALGRKYVRISLGGVRDEAEIRGHRRTYVGAAPGRIVEGIRRAGSSNPVMVLDEIDKLASDWQGDPMSALLEALDPEQNHEFHDRYFDVPVNLGGVIFVVTANQLDALTPALLDRLDVMDCPAYTDEERYEILRRHLFPRALHEHGLAPGDVEIAQENLHRLATAYASEAGVRQLARLTATLCRKAARQRSENPNRRVRIDAARIDKWLGPCYTCMGLSAAVGSAVGMVVTPFGGALIRVEASLLRPVGPTPDVRLTGNLGNVMRESALAALTAVRSLDSAPKARGFNDDVHIHVPAGGIPKDGPSAGLTIAVALASAAQKREVRERLAFSGEITLQGAILPVGGLREKLMAAVRAGVAEAIVPSANQPDVERLPKSIASKLKVTCVSTLEEALRIASAPR